MNGVRDTDKGTFGLFTFERMWKSLSHVLIRTPLVRWGPLRPQFTGTEVVFCFFLILEKKIKTYNNVFQIG